MSEEWADVVATWENPDTRTWDEIYHAVERVMRLREDTAPTVIVEGAEAALAGADQHCRSAETVASDPLRPPTVCPTCGSDDPPWIVSSRGKEPALCPDPFHSTVPCPVCGGTGRKRSVTIDEFVEYGTSHPCPRGCTPEGDAP